MDSIYKVVDRQSHLRLEQADQIAALVVSNNDRVLAEIDTLTAQDRQLPLEMPLLIPPNPNLQQHKKKGSTRKRALTGAEAAERQERVIQARTRSQAQAQAAKRAVESRRQTRGQAAKGIM
ncbi:MAG: hypothetical protein M1813_002395 [Trichoglossum hirsutum]|nr:MAG: hypothetical protein M1813_002395 [Trichoglossum hirsutum]